MKQFLLAAFLALITNLGSAQFTIGLPEIANYTKQAYHGGAQTRQIAQDQNGILYFANDEGLLTFNSIHWKIYPLPNKSLVRCLEFGDDKNLYVGGQDEFGYFSPAENGSLQYHSLKQLIPEKDRSFADVWEISFADNSVFFQTSDRIYQLKNNRITVYRDDHWRFMGKAGDILVAQSGKLGLLHYRSGKWLPFSEQANETLPSAYFATSLTAIGRDSVLLTTLKNGIYLLTGGEIKKWQFPLAKELENKNISSSLMVNENQIAIGTNVEGCFILDKKGVLVQRLGREEGLQDNSILTIFLDQQKNIWFGLHNGIDFIPYNNAVKHINPLSMNEGAGFTSYIYNKELFLGTSIGLFKCPLVPEEDLSNLHSRLVPVKNSTGEVWNLSEVNGQLLMGHNEGAFIINGDNASSLDKTTGYWNFLPFYPLQPSALMIAGTYRGIAFYRHRDKSFSKIQGEAVIESARFVTTAHNRVWFSHPYKGIYSVVVKDSVSSYKKYARKEGITSDNNNYLFKVKNELILTTERGIFKYNPEKDLFETSTFYNKHLPAVPIRYLKEDKEGSVWFVFEKKIGVLDLTSASPQVIYLPELTNKFVAGFEHINPIDKNNILVGGEKGFYHINYDQYKHLKYPLQVMLGTVSAISQKDSLIFGGYGGDVYNSQAPHTKGITLSHSYNSLHFEFASPVYGQSSNIEYSFYLQGFDNNWSEFSKKTEKDYTNLPPGKYVFKVKARNNLGNESAIKEYSFQILPPWYQTTAAYVLYILLFLTGGYLLYRYQRKKFLAQQLRYEDEQRKLQYLHQLEIEKAEKELVELRNAKLEAEITMKNSELATTALHLIQKNDVLLKIKAQMTKLKDTSVAVQTTADLKNILKTLNEENKVEEQWHQFSLHFDSVHSNFLSNLKRVHPNLTLNELKLCAYLKMNLTTKEIAQLMNISPRGVEISRYRLRKKLTVPSGMQLFNFLDTIS